MSEYTMMDIERVLNGTSSAIRGTEDELKAIIRQLLPDARAMVEIRTAMINLKQEKVDNEKFIKSIRAAMEAEAKGKEG